MLGFQLQKLQTMSWLKISSLVIFAQTMLWRFSMENKHTFDP